MLDSWGLINAEAAVSAPAPLGAQLIQQTN